jgi:hypothetical protein
MFYHSDELTDFEIDVPNYDEEEPQEKLNKYKSIYRNVFDHFNEHPLEIRMEADLWKLLSKHFYKKQTDFRAYDNLTTEDVVKRAGLICFRVAMILTAIDSFDSEVKEDFVYVKKESLEASIILIDYLLNHNLKVLDLVPNTNQTLSKPIDKYSALEQVNDEFTTAEFSRSAGFTEKTAQRRLKSFLSDGRIILIKKGKYKKT